ncbi:MAG TPA: DUF2207 domain-containing protein [Longimicrobium sp.]|nr:DUF2207 domain-containing protein [Longimicrobium sp.]
MRRLLLVLCLVLAAARPAAAQGDSIKVRLFEATLMVNRDGTLDVTERLRIAFFGPWNGLNRDLSLGHNTGQGRREKLDIEIAPPTDGEGRPLRYETEDLEGWNERLKIWIPGARDAERTIVVRYRVRNAIRFFYAGSDAGALDELYWNVTGNAWTMPIERVEARVVLPDGVVPARRAVYTGAEGATGAADAEIAEVTGGLLFTTRRTLAPGEGITVAAGWAPGAILSRPSEAAVKRAETMRFWPLPIPLVVLLLALRSWRKRGRDPREESITVQYEPPAGMSPAELGTLVDHEADLRDVTATLVDLAVRGYVGIEEKTEKTLLVFTNTDYVFHLRRPREEWTELADHERRFLDALFSSATTAGEAWEVVKAAFADARRAHQAGEEFDRGALTARLASAGSAPAEVVRLSDLKNKFYRSLPGIRDAIYDRLLERGYYRARPDKVKGNWVGLGVAILVVFGVAAAVAGESGAAWVSPVALLIAGGVSAVSLIAVGMVMPARTEAGARAREAALGFREFLDRVESDRYRRMVTSPELFERYLPYAMAFEVEGRWAKAFDDIYREPPQWYSGGGYDGFRASTFASRMNGLSSTAGSTMSSSPSSSGSSGGGSSGGGSGGGGGSGF